MCDGQRDVGAHDAQQPAHSYDEGVPGVRKDHLGVLCVCVGCSVCVLCVQHEYGIKKEHVSQRRGGDLGDEDKDHGDD